MSHFENPYVAGEPVHGGRGFFGRQDILDWAAMELRNPDNTVLLLFGQRGVGKTSLLLQLERILPASEFVPVYFDLQGQAARPLNQVLTGLASAMSERIGLQSPDLYLFDEHGHFFRHTFLPRFQAVAVKDGRRLVLLLDEFDILTEATRATMSESAAIAALFPFLRGLRTDAACPAFVIVLGRQASDLMLDSAATFGATRVREVASLGWEHAEALVRQAEVDSTVRFTDLALSRLLTLTNRHPHWMQLLCRQIWERVQSGRTGEAHLIDTLAVEEALPDALRQGEEPLAWLWDGLSVAEQAFAAALAETVGEGEAVSEAQVLRAIASRAGSPCVPDAELAADMLVKRWVLKRTEGRGQGGECGFATEVFRLWVRRNRPLDDVIRECQGLDPDTARLSLARTSAVQPSAQGGSDERSRAIQTHGADQEASVSPQSHPLSVKVARPLSTQIQGGAPLADDLEPASVSVLGRIFRDVVQWTVWVREALGKADLVQALRLVLPAVVVPILSGFIFYAIGVSLARGMSGIGWLPSPFDGATFFHFGLISAALGLLGGLWFSYEFVRHPVLTLELAYLSLNRYAYPFLAVILVYGALTLLAWISRTSVPEEEWEGFRIFFSWVRKLWE